MGPPLSERPSLPTETERLEARERERAAKDLRQTERGRAVSQMRVRERAKLERMAAHEAFIERKKREKEERIAIQLAEGKGPDEKMKRLEKALGQLKSEKTAQRMKKLAEARVLCREMYEEMNEKQRARMRKLDWMVAVLNDASPVAAIIDMMQNGKSKDEIVAQSVKLEQYYEAESIANQIVSQAHNHLERKSAVWKRAAQAIAAREKAASMNDNTQAKIAFYGLSIEDLEQPRLPESRAAAQNLLDAVILPPGIESIDPQASFQQRVSQAEEILPQFEKPARELRTRLENKPSVDNTLFDRAILEAATAYYEDMALQLKRKIARLERFKRFVEKYPDARATPSKFSAVVQLMALSKSEMAAATKEFPTFYEQRKGTETTAETNESGNAVNATKREVDTIRDSSMQPKVDAQDTTLHGGVEAQHAGTGNLERDDKERRDLPVIKHRKGLINEWTQEDTGKAANVGDKALKNKEQVRELNTGNEGKENEEKKGGEEKNGGSIFGWFRGS